MLAYSADSEFFLPPDIINAAVAETHLNKKRDFITVLLHHQVPFSVHCCVKMLENKWRPCSPATRQCLTATSCTLACVKSATAHLVAIIEDSDIMALCQQFLGQVKTNECMAASFGVHNQALVCTDLYCCTSRHCTHHWA